MNYNLAIVGATGAVGRNLLFTIDNRNFPFDNIYLLASKKSSGKKINFREKEYIIQDLENFDFSNADIAFFSAGSSVSSKYAIEAEKCDCYVVDNTSFFRQQPDIPLIVPEVNSSDLDKTKRRIISNPNCSTIQMLVALDPIHKINSIKKIVVSTYQSVSGAGQQAMNELTIQSECFLNKSKIVSNIFPKQIAFNVLPQIDTFTENGFTKEEMKMVNETKKILDSNIEVNATCVRVPSYIGHAESVYIELENKIDLNDIENVLNESEGIKYDKENFHTPLDSAGKDWVYVSRLRKDLVKDNALNLWIVSDNLLKGAALNSVQIGELLIKKKFVRNYE